MRRYLISLIAHHKPTNLSDQLAGLIMMREIQSAAAKTHLPQLLDDVERGETIVITRHGRPIARLIPDEDARRARRLQAVADIEELRRQNGSVTVEELLSWRHEGHKR